MTGVLNEELIQRIAADYRTAYEPEAISAFRNVINGGDPWHVIETIWKVNNNVGKSTLHKLT